MNMIFGRWSRPALALAAVALATALIGSPASALSGGDGHGRSRSVEVVTYNIDLGADLAPLFTVRDLTEIAPDPAKAWADVQASDFPARSVALAKVLGHARPDVIGLQEVALWSNGPFNPLNPFAKVTFTPQIDFLRLLLTALDGRGVHYEAVATNMTFTGQAPISASEQLQYVDQNVILMRSGRHAELTARNADSKVYAAGIPTKIPAGQPAPNQVLTITRG